MSFVPLIVLLQNATLWAVNVAITQKSVPSDLSDTQFLQLKQLRYHDWILRTILINTN